MGGVWGMWREAECPQPGEFQKWEFQPNHSRRRRLTCLKHVFQMMGHTDVKIVGSWTTAQSHRHREMRSRHSKGITKPAFFICTSAFLKWNAITVPHATKRKDSALFHNKKNSASVLHATWKQENLTDFLRMLSRTKPIGEFSCLHLQRLDFTTNL